MSDRDRPKRDPQNADFQDAVRRLETAVSDLMSSAGGRVADGATRMIDDATRALEREMKRDWTGSGSRSDRRSNDDFLGFGGGDGSDWSGLGLGSSDGYDGVSSGKRAGDALMRDKANGKLAGVCAGIARYYGVESWVVRCIAITGLLFMPQIVFPAYVIAIFVMNRDDRAEPAAVSATTSGGRRRRRRRRAERASEETPTAQVPPRTRLRSARGAFDDLEMRLRRMESHVTSGRYDLQRELGKIDPVVKPV